MNRPQAVDATLRMSPREAWILAGTLDGRTARPGLDDQVAGMPHLVRLVGELVLAGVSRVTVVWQARDPAPEVAAIAGRNQLAARAELTIASAPPPGDATDPIVVVRADRIFHRELPGCAIRAWRAGTAPIAKLAGDELDAVVVAERAHAAELVPAATANGGWARALAGHRAIATAPPPYLGFNASAGDAVELRRAERTLVWSLRKPADGIASKLVNRHISLPITWLLMRTSVRPNHVTIAAFICAFAGGLVIGRGGYAAGVAGMLLVEAGSIIDGIDGELARLKFLFSRLGQWLDTVVDDLGNVAYSTGIMVNLHAAGVSWALPLWAAANAAFVLTQGTQYALIAIVYNSGDLAAIPWAFQSSAFLSQRPTGWTAWLGATAPKLLKRDFAVTVFVAFALLGHLDWVLVIYSAGTLVFFCVFFVQLVRNRHAIKRRAAPG